MFDDATAKRFSFGKFSARYGNVYTARQLLQLVQRAYGSVNPLADHWQVPEADRPRPGRVVDRFRPQIHPEGFASIAELEADRANSSPQSAAPLKSRMFLFLPLA